MLKRKITGAIGVIEIMLVIVVLTVVGLVIWRVMSDNESTVEESTTEDTANDSTEQADPMPEGWVTYTNDELDFTFSYPLEWGDVEFDLYFNGDMAKGNGVVDYEGEAWHLGFGNFELLTAALFSSDYQYTGLGFGVRAPYGVIDFDGLTTYGEGLVETREDIKVIAIAGMGVEFDGVSIYRRTTSATYPVFDVFYDAEDVEGIAASASNDQYHPEQYVDQQVEADLYEDIIGFAESFEFLTTQ